jgi:hypothetical protein
MITAKPMQLIQGLLLGGSKSLLVASISQPMTWMLGINMIETTLMPR